jgi:hypothetical protein
MNFEKVGIDEASLIRKMSRIRFFDSLSCNIVFGIFLQNATFQTKISNMGETCKTRNIHRLMGALKEILS